MIKIEMQKKNALRRILRSLNFHVGGLLLILQGCTGIPEGLVAVNDFDADRYLGKWYEIARLDHSFERGLERVTAEYLRRDDGGIRVLNRGYLPETGEWKEAEGKAYFIENDTLGRLKVSFFGPFYSGYNIIDLDRVGYRWAIVCGPDRSYLWILSRAPKMEESLEKQMRARAESWGFPVQDLISVRH